MTSKRILLVDDEPNVLRALKLLLEAIGHSVTDYSDPKEALTHIAARTGDYDLILCDLRMPGANGYEVLKSAREHRAATPFVLISGHATQQEVQRAYELGAHGFLGKPFTPEKLRNLLEHLEASSPSTS